MEDEKCLVELNEVLKRLDDDDLNKIPLEIIEAINSKKDKKYKWQYDDSKKLEEQDLNRKTIAMLSYLNMEYLLDNKQKAVMEELHRFNERKLERAKREKYDSEKMFDNKNIEKNLKKTEEENKVDMQIAVKKEMKWYKKVLRYILNIIKK